MSHRLLWMHQEFLEAYMEDPPPPPPKNPTHRYFLCYLDSPWVNCFPGPQPQSSSRGSISLKLVH